MTDKLLQIVLATFAVYRLSHALALADGPFDIFARFRDWIGVDEQRTWVQRGLGCPACISFWVSLVFALVFILPASTISRKTVIDLCLLWFGIAGAVLFLLKWNNQGE